MLIGIDIGGTKCAITLGDEQGNVLKKVRFATAAPKETIQKIVETAKQLKTDDTHAAGISCGGPLDEEKGIILSPPNLVGWDEVHIKEILEKELSIPVGVRNDANACAIAELYFGAAKGCKNAVFMTFGTGLGAGLIIDGKLYSGTNGFAGELGHIRLDAFGPAGYGKSGSFEGFCSGGGIRELARALAREAEQRGEKPAWFSDSFTVADVAEAARQGDATAIEAFSISGKKLGQGLSIVIDLLNPEKIIIGSVFARCRDLLVPEMEKVIRQESLRQARAVCEITVPGLGEAIGDTAALAVATEVYHEIRR